jgi:hypothetical protein
MAGYAPMAFHLETERLSMRPWAISDAGELSALWSERASGTPGVERAREVIANGLARTAETGLAVRLSGAAIATGRKRLWSTVGTWNTPSFRVLEKLGFKRDHVSADDGGELVWLTRSLP